MPKLTMLQQRVAPMRRQQAPVVQRTRGDAWMKIRERILRRDNGLCRCADCAKLAVPLLATEVDHIVELADGGSDDDSNLQAINHDCHARKTQAARQARGQTA